MNNHEQLNIQACKLFIYYVFEQGLLVAICVLSSSPNGVSGYSQVILLYTTGNVQVICERIIRCSLKLWEHVSLDNSWIIWFVVVCLAPRKSCN